VQIEIHLPRATEAKVSYDAKAGVLTIEPLFRSASAVHPYAYARVVGKGGRERKYALCVAGTNGRLVSQELGAVVTDFDGPAGEGAEDKGVEE
jgi:hypothetical protein